jgi:hypothetical protein
MSTMPDVMGLLLDEQDAQVLLKYMAIIGPSATEADKPVMREIYRRLKGMLDAREKAKQTAKQRLTPKEREVQNWAALRGRAI